MKYNKAKDGSFVHNCIIEKRHNDKARFLFSASDDTVTCSLNGYAIIPIEEYAKLKGESVDLTNINKAYNDLYP